MEIGPSDHFFLNASLDEPLRLSLLVGDAVSIARLVEVTEEAAAD